MKPLFIIGLVIAALILGVTGYTQKDWHYWMFCGLFAGAAAYTLLKKN